MSKENNGLNKSSESRSEEIQELSPKDEATRSMQMVYGQASASDPDSLTDDFEDDYPFHNDTLDEGDQFQEDSLVAEEGTPVDPAAPPTEIFHGTDLLNGYNGED
ncbi:hypothetical protein [Paenibacillus radicis (ex Xue et al. 2023)]|uniref:Uncharacterized protein n=1 Tax=Paenibacillus radicis (ex Xue et al. 2023) TaxID=2972489 RepID=A0ABT1YHB1_9BACL|nr:hypothetical protein [Paenibacillus radicis (ex Xue et al. 2023)]MCR8631335.1 hypothetical protein [Paenibacillus radicis (ex Xue et al. 2023)]